MAILKIYNDITSEQEKKMFKMFGDVDTVCFKDISEFIESIPENDNKISLRLNCRGGSVSEGWAMYDLLRSTGKEISAIVEGVCASMATIILCAAKKELRSGNPNAKLCIHSPYIPEFTLSESYKAEDLERIASELREEHEKFLDVYVERTGAIREELDSLMKEDKYISMERARELGFINNVLVAKSAIKFYEMSKNKKTVKQAFKDLAVAIGVADDVVAMELSTESGETLTIEREEGEPSVGDVASPDGNHVMPDGTTIVVVDGVITEIKPAEQEETELEEAKKRIAALEKELEEEKEKKEAFKSKAKTSEEMEILNAVKIAGGKEWLAKARSGFKPQERTNDRSSFERKVSLVDYLENKKNK